MTAILEVEEIFQWLKESRQRDGLTVAKVHDNERVADAFGDGSASKAFENIRSVAEQLNASPGVVAACNALAIGVPVQRNTTARRVTLLMENADVFGMTERNLLRTEDKGLWEMAVALYSQQPGAGKLADELTESPELSVSSNEKDSEDDGDGLGAIWESLLIMAKKIGILQRENDLLFKTRVVREDIQNDSEFQRSYREWMRTARQAPSDYEAIIEKMEAVRLEADRVVRESMPPVPIIGDSLRIDPPNVLKPSI